MNSQRTDRREFSNKDPVPPIFTNMPPSISEGWSSEPLLGVPHGFFSQHHSNTVWLLNIICDTSNRRLCRALAQPRTGVLFRTDQYFQLVDRPAKYCKQLVNFRPMFHNQSHLYMNAFGIAIYLQKYKMLATLAEQWLDNHPMYNPNQRNFATGITHNVSGEILIFHYDYLVLKRDAYDALEFLLEIGWAPRDSSLLVYRRRNYQFVTPFIDWIDVCCDILKKKPGLQIYKIVQHLAGRHSRDYKIAELRDLGTVMLEYFELRQFTHENCNDNDKIGLYVGRKLMKNSTPTLPVQLAKAFCGEPVRPVLPHAVSDPRRLLCYSYYDDNETLSSLSQVLRALEVFLNANYFVCGHICSSAAWHRDPLVFQIFEFAHIRFRPQLNDQITKQVTLARHYPWSTISSYPYIVCWFRRFDILNCIALLFGLLQMCLYKNASSSVVDRICRILVDVLIRSEFMEPFLTYSCVDTYCAMHSLVNCVPALQISSLMRVIKMVPALITKKYPAVQIDQMFSDQFWAQFNGYFHPNRPRTLDEIGDYLVLYNRRLSIQTDDSDRIQETVESGRYFLFARDINQMKSDSEMSWKIPAMQKVNFMKKAATEAAHIAAYKKMELDYRYGSVLGTSYRLATDRPKICLQENKTFDQSVRDSLALQVALL